MLKFATKKPPRLKHYETGNVTKKDEGRMSYGEGQGHIHGQYGGGMSGQEGTQHALHHVNLNMEPGSYVDSRDQRGYVYSSESLPRTHWKAFNVKYGKVGLEKEIEIPVQSTKPVGFIRNGISHDSDVRSHYNPGYETLTDSRQNMDMNRNVYPQHGPPSYSRGPVYYPASHSQDYNSNRHIHYINGTVHSPSQAFPDRSLSTDSNGNYGNPYSFDSTASMSLESMSTSGDRSSKSVSETPDYDMLLDISQTERKRLDNKPPLSPHKHRHIHVGRGAHGICDSPQSSIRPGSSDNHMTSSLRKSPSFRTGHHVRWGPGVVNSGQKVIDPHATQTLVNGQHGAPAPKKPKKKTSLRTLLNIPRFPVSDEDLTDYASDSSYSSKVINVSKENTVDIDDHSPVTEILRAPPATELSCLQYMKQFPPLRKEVSAPAKGNQLKVNITSANQQPIRSGFAMTSPQQVKQKPNVPSETAAIRYPIVHSGTDSKNRSQVNSVRPFLINGLCGETLEYDNVEEKTAIQSSPISVKSPELSGGHVFTGGLLTDKGLNESSRQNTSVTQAAIPVTFDTFVTLGRPSESSVTFDTFVTLGRPYATSTPVPNGNLGYVQNVGQEFTSFNKLDKDHDWKSTGIVVTSGNKQSSVFTSVNRKFPTTVTQSWKYSVGTQQSGAVPIAVHSTLRSAQEPALMHTASFPVSHDGHVTRSGLVFNPYEMENRVYGKLSSPPYTLITRAPVTAGPTHIPYAQTQTSYSVQTRSHDQSHGQTAVGAQAPQSPFKDLCSYRPKDFPDYDDETVFSDLVARLSPGLQESARSARRKLQFEGASSNGQVVTSCVPQLNHEVNHDELNHNYSGYPKVQAVPGVTQQRNMSSNINESISIGDKSDMDSILDLVYITERIISMSFASEEHETTYKYNLKEVTRMLKTKHQDNYLVINISDKRPELAKLCPQVLDYGWPENLAPPLERLCSICKAIDEWMGSNPNHVVVVHCKGGRGRIAVVIAAYMRYSNICASADQALDRFAMKRFYDDKLGGLPQPSQRRYVHYFAGLLSGAIQINSSALYLHHILIHGVPNFDLRGGCRPFIKVYQGMHPIFTSGVYNVTDNMQKVCISISPGIPLRGDILIKCYHKKNKAGQRDIMWGCQFHTCAISHNSLVFSKNELDYGINDPRFPDTGKVEFVFGNNSEGLVQVADFKSDVTVPVDDSTEAITRWDSYENFGKATDKEHQDVNANGIPVTDGVDSFRVTQLEHSQGPVDGSLYAQINKRKLETQILQNGPTKLQNGGSYTSSVDSVPMGMSTTQKSSSESWSYRTSERERERDHLQQPNMSSYSSKSYSSSSTSPRTGGKVALDEQAQLDKILSDLLDEKSFVSSKTQSGQNVMKFKEDVMSPEGNIVVQRGDVTYKVPEVRQEKHTTMKTEVKTVSEDKSYKPVNAFTYTPSSPEMSRSFEPIRSPGSPKVGSSPYRTDYENNYKKDSSYSYQTNGPSSLSDGELNMSWLQQQQAKLRERSLERDPKHVQNERMMLEELKTAQSQNKYFQKRSKTEEESSSKAATSVSNGPTSPYSYTISRTHQYNTEKTPGDTATFRSHDSPQTIGHSHTTYITEQTSSKVSNKPPPSPGIQRTVTPTLSAPAAPPQRTSSKDYMQHQHQQQHQQQQQTRNRTFSGGAYQTSSTNSWKTETQHQPRTVQRTHSESAYDREIERQFAPRSYTTSPISPRSVSPQTYQSYKTVYKTIHHKDEPDFVKPVEVKIEKQTQQSQHTVQEQKKPHYITEVIVQRTGGADSKSSTLNRNERETENRLEALEKTLQAAQDSILATSPWQQKQQQQQQQTVQQQEIRQFETRTYETKSEHREERQHQESVQQSHSEPALPPPKKIEVTEEDRITLKPIGPGVHQLEPEGSHTGTLGRESTSTLGRSTTPSFPTSPTASAGGHVSGPGGGLSSEKMQFQQYSQNQNYQTQTLPHNTQVGQAFQTQTLPHNTQVAQNFQSSTLPHQSNFQQQQQQQQSYQKSYQSSSSSSQQYSSQQYSGSNKDGSLHVDTNQPRMMLHNARSPSSPGSPPSPGNLNTLRQQLHIAHNMSGNAISPGPHSATGQSSPSVYFGLSRRGSLTSLDAEAVMTTPKFVKDTSKFWYKPNITREEAIMMLKDRAPGTFVVRDSNSFPGAFGLALKVATLPPNVQTKSTGDPMADLVRHFLIEPTSKGVRLRGCSNEPVFGSLASLVYQHSITPLALPCKLMLPEHDPHMLSADLSPTTEAPSSASALLAQGAACNVIFLNTVDTESLTGPQAVAKACKMTFDHPPPKTTMVHFKVSNQGITLTDNQRKLFFRRHYPVAAVTYCGMDPEDRRWRRQGEVPGTEVDVKVFGFIARKQGSISDNACHLFAELDPDQPANAIVNFVTKVMIGQGKIKS